MPIQSLGKESSVCLLHYTTTYIIIDTLEYWNLITAYSLVILQKGLHTSKQLPC